MKNDFIIIIMETCALSRLGGRAVPEEWSLIVTESIHPYRKEKNILTTTTGLDACEPAFLKIWLKERREGSWFLFVLWSLLGLYPNPCFPGLSLIMGSSGIPWESLPNPCPGKYPFLVSTWATFFIYRGNVSTLAISNAWKAVSKASSVAST